MDNQLFKLGNNLDYWRSKYNNCHKFFKSEFYIMYEKAKEEYAEYYRNTYRKANIESKPFKHQLRMSDWVEVFENYEY